METIPVDIVDRCQPVFHAPRCDRCGVDAQAKAIRCDGVRLDLCGHHQRQHKQALTAAGFILAEL